MFYKKLFVTTLLACVASTAYGQFRPRTTVQARNIASASLPAYGVVPGSGQQITEVGDDFESTKWTWNPNLPKVYNHKDSTQSKNFPLGAAANGRWFEGQVRGQPDSVRRVPTPEGGLAGSTGALALKTLRSGAEYPGNQQQQDDFIANVAERVGKLSVSQSPSVVTRVWLPPIDQWENRTGCHFAFRVGLHTDPNATMQGGIRNDKFDGIYWPGMFIHMNSKEGRGATGQPHDSAYIWIKATDDGRQMRGPQITVSGWWTMGMSVTEDGRVHFYAKPGIEDLTPEDHVGSSFPFGYRAQHLRSFFFNVCNGDDGRTWSTEFVIDDPKVFVKR